MIYTPPDYSEEDLKKVNKSINITTGIVNSDVKSSISFKLTSIPIVFLHGYLSNHDLLNDMIDYFSKKNYNCSSIDYHSENGVKASANELNTFLLNKKIEYLNKGIQINKYILVAHSMGGLVTRYYTSSEQYIKNNNVSKLIFISVPHNGSHIAYLGLNYYNDQGIKDLIKGSSLFTILFPNMINIGLNSSIQVGNILGQYDEVVSLEDDSLSEWGIETEVFNVGGNNLSINSIINGNITISPNHKAILNNLKVFDRIKDMADHNLPYPILRKK